MSGVSVVNNFPHTRNRIREEEHHVRVCEYRTYPPLSRTLPWYVGSPQRGIADALYVRSIYTPLLSAALRGHCCTLCHNQSCFAALCCRGLWIVFNLHPIQILSSGKTSTTGSVWIRNLMHSRCSQRCINLLYASVCKTTKVYVGDTI